MPSPSSLYRHHVHLFVSPKGKYVHCCYRHYHATATLTSACHPKGSMSSLLPSSPCRSNDLHLSREGGPLLPSPCAVAPDRGPTSIRAAPHYMKAHAMGFSLWATFFLAHLIPTEQTCIYSTIHVERILTFKRSFTLNLENIIILKFISWRVILV